MIGRTLSEEGRPGAWWIGVAVAALVALAFVWMRCRPGRSDGATSAAQTVIEIVEPRGELATAPFRFEWRPVPRADLYELTISDDDAIWPLFVRRTQSAVHLLDPGERSALRPGRIHLWEVAALAEDGSAIAREQARFRIGPAPEGASQ